MVYLKESPSRVKLSKENLTLNLTSSEYFSLNLKRLLPLVFFSAFTSTGITSFSF